MVKFWTDEKGRTRKDDSAEGVRSDEYIPSSVGKSNLPSQSSESMVDKVTFAGKRLEFVKGRKEKKASKKAKEKEEEKKEEKKKELIKEVIKKVDKGEPVEIVDYKSGGKLPSSSSKESKEIESIQKRITELTEEVAKETDEIKAAKLNDEINSLQTKLDPLMAEVRAIESAKQTGNSGIVSDANKTIVLTAPTQPQMNPEDEKARERMIEENSEAVDNARGGSGVIVKKQKTDDSTTVSNQKLSLISAGLDVNG